MKIPFNVKFRPQIESGEYKVVCCEREYPVTILMWDFKDPDGYNILAYYEDKKGQHPLMYDNDGKLYHDKSGIFDLFIITPEPELTEFEIRLLDWLSNDTSGEIPMERMKKVVRNRAAELHSLARKEFENEAPSIIEAQSFKAGFKAGKAEALKDFPRWKRIRKGERLPETSYIWDFAYGERNGGGISTNWLLPNIPCVVGCDAWYIPVDVIKNLPREDEDEK